MERKNNRKLYIAVCMLAAFVLWTVAVCFADVQAIGPRGSTVGFAGANRFFHDLTGVHMTLYRVTDWMGLVPLGIVMGFAVMGLIQWIRRKALHRVDYSILVLGGFYLVVLAVYILFETVVVNYRPILIEEVLEASYPSSTTMLAMCVMPTAMLQFHERLQNKTLRKWIDWAITAFMVFMVTGRLLSGVHWVTDIVGGILLSSGLVMLYDFISSLKRR